MGAEYIVQLDRKLTTVTNKMSEISCLFSLDDPNAEFWCDNMTMVSILFRVSLSSKAHAVIDVSIKFQLTKVVND